MRSAAAGVQMQREGGAMPQGHNGPHRHKMTVARNTSHWAIAFVHAYELSGQERFLQAGRAALNLLMSRSLRPHGGSFWHRFKNGRDQMNGLIGQTWSLEALYYGWKKLGDVRYREVALDVFLKHRYDWQMGLWYRLDLDGTTVDHELVLNQQIWFAAIGSWLADVDLPSITRMVENFLSRLPEKIVLGPRGRMPRAVLSKPRVRSRVKQWFRNSRNSEIEIGYHVFTLCGLAHLFWRFPNHWFWSTGIFARALKFCFSYELWNDLCDNRYGFSYNVPGFELPYVFLAFESLAPSSKNAEEMCQKYMRHQIDCHYNFSVNLLERNTDDSETLAARLYEGWRIVSSDEADVVSVL